MKIRKKGAIQFSGITWLIIGTLLIYRGISYLGQVGSEGAHTALNFLFGSLYSPSGTCTLGFFALVFGGAKGYYVFSQTVHRVVERMTHLPEPIPIRQIYTGKYCLLIVGMSMLGMCLRFLSLPCDIHGFLDLTIGVALVIGSLFYFRASCS